MEEKVFRLPSAEEMERRLVGVTDSAHMRQHLYPALLKNAGQQKTADGVVMMIVLAIGDYMEGVPPVVLYTTGQLASLLVEALIDDEGAVAEAKISLKKALDASWFPQEPEWRGGISS